VALKRQLRLRKSRDFQRVRQQGRSVSSRLLTLAWVPGTGEHVRIGLVAGRRVFKLATRRNRVKRLLGEAIRPFLPALQGAHKVDLVLIPKREALEADLHRLQVELEMLLHRARLLPLGQEAERRLQERESKGRQP
jgi:ribonuclease P protein component